MNPQRYAPFNRSVTVGLVLLIVANVTKVILERLTPIGPDGRDLLFGLLMGFAIGSLLLGLWRMSHPAQGTGHPPTQR